MLRHRQNHFGHAHSPSAKKSPKPGPEAVGSKVPVLGMNQDSVPVLCEVGRSQPCRQQHLTVNNVGLGTHKGSRKVPGRYPRIVVDKLPPPPFKSENVLSVGSPTPPNFGHYGAPQNVDVKKVRVDARAARRKPLGPNEGRSKRCLGRGIPVGDPKNFHRRERISRRNSIRTAKALRASMAID